MASASVHIIPQVKICHRVREWKQEKLRGEFAVSMCEPADEEGIARETDLMDATLRDIEGGIIANVDQMEGVDDLQAVVSVGILILNDPDMIPDGVHRARSMLRIVHHGANLIRKRSPRG